ncbi:MAG TPA: D-alanyl-D-alanine carboxypeptidase/D-alanyl-D-alanine-endopeptidase [Terriglobales bacterium]|nr:D-alanyl-D-alanine carboxypeptidase/D-alanyl-D-alanine-endopeptidase [Terriglobales bacterium]
MPRLRILLAALLLLSLAAAPASARKKPRPEERQRALAARIDRILAEPEAGRAFWGIEIRAADGRLLYSRNPDKLFTPASNTKLFTTAAALALIGPEYKFQTTVETAGTLDTHGRLAGDLVLVGRGDPNLSGRNLPFKVRTQRDQPPDKVLEDLADQIVQKGVKYVDGDVVGDDSFYAFERYGEGWSQEDLATQWGAPVSALTINDNVLTVKVLPGDRPGRRPSSPSILSPTITGWTTASSPHPRARARAASTSAASPVPTAWCCGATSRWTTPGAPSNSPSRTPPSSPPISSAPCWRSGGW